MAKTFAVRIVFGIFLSLILSSCGNKSSAYDSFEKTSLGCEGNAASQQFIVQFFDGSSKVVRANSKEEFIEGYLTENLNRIAYAEHDYSVHVETPSATGSPKIFSQFADNWGAERVNASALWSQGIYGSGITVAVVDTGVDIVHPQLQGRIFVNSGEQGLDSHGRDKASNGIDDDGNGFVDDISGYDFVSDTALTGDNQYHGTHVAGIIAAEHNDSTASEQPYVQGLAPRASLLPLAFLDSTGDGVISSGVAAIKYAVAQGARVINASWGGSGCSRSLQETISTLASKNIFFVSAAGNESSNIDRWPTYPASLVLPAQLVVGATGSFDNMSQYSNYGAKSVLLFAPGDEIISTFPGNQMYSLSGTSMATPFVAGAVALLLSAEPTASIAQVRQALSQAAYHRSEYLNSSRGRLDLRVALQKLRAML